MESVDNWPDDPMDLDGLDDLNDRLADLMDLDEPAAWDNSTRLPDSVAHSPLFKLSPELRNLIYRFTLVEEKRISINKRQGIPEPTLLSVCKIIRAETFGIYYQENKFVCQLDSYDPAALCLVKRKLDTNKMSNQKTGLSRYQIHVFGRGSPDWKNLMSSLLAYHQRRCAGITRVANERRSGPELILVTGLFGMVKVAHGNPSISLETMRLLIEQARPALVASRSGWAKD